MNLATLAPWVQRGTSHSLFPGAALVALGVLILGGAYAFQYIGGLKPCALCLEQRVPWFVLIGLGGAILAVQTFGQSLSLPRALLVGLYAGATAVALWGAYLAFFHAGVEYKWWPGPEDCAALDLPTAGDVLGPLSPTQVVRCDEIVWSLFGITMAGYNFFFSLIAASLAGFGGWTIWKGMR
jgi:disulfide bond formation protein DsbB